MGEPFENSEAWKSARALTNRVYSFCRREPLARDFGLRDQLQRAAVSVMNNVAEGWESLHPAEKRQACNIARRSCGEVRSMSHVLFENQLCGRPAASLAPIGGEGRGEGAIRSDLNAIQYEQQSLLDGCIQTGRLITGLIRALGDRT